MRWPRALRALSIAVVFGILAGTAAHAAVLNVPADYPTIQACANAAQPGDTCLVAPGQYGRTDTGRNPVKSGTGESPIIFKGEPGAVSNGFHVRGDHFKISGFTFTGNLESGAAMVHVAGDHVEVFDNTFTGTFTTFITAMIYLAGAHNHAHHNVIHDWVNPTPESSAIVALGSHGVIEYNTIKNVNDINSFRAFGHDHVFRGNFVQNVYSGPVATHIDFVQTFGNNGNIAYNIIFENNFIDGHAGQLGQLVQSCGPAPEGYSPNICGEVPGANGVVTGVAGDSLTDSNVSSWNPGRWPLADDRGYIVYLVSGERLGSVFVIKSHTANTLTLMNPDGTPANLIPTGGPKVKVGDLYEIRNRNGWWTFRNNLFKDFSLGMSGSLVHLEFTNNTYINTGGTFSGGSQDRGRALNGTVVSNIHISDGLPYGPQDEPSKTTFFADYNFAAGPAPGYEKKDDSRNCGSEYGSFRFCEEIYVDPITGTKKHGINGGNPQFANINDPLGPDGIPFTVDDGFKPLPGSIVCGKGPGGTDIGVYSCDSAKVFSDGFDPISRPPNPFSRDDARSRVATKFGIFKNVFNPTKEHLIIKYIAAGDDSMLTVYDRNGREIRLLAPSVAASDGYQTVWDGRSGSGSIVASGTYVLVLKHGGDIVKKKVVVLK